MNISFNNTTSLDVTTANSTDYYDFYDRDEALAKVEIATLAVIFIVTVIGNGTVLLALWTRKRYAGRKKLSRMYFFILHLSIADLVTAFLNTLPQLGWDITYRFNGGVALCKIVKYCQTLGPYLSSYILMATAIDRHQAICYPLTYCSWTSRRSKVMVWLAWATSLAFCIPQVTIFAYQEVAPGISDCWATFPQPWGARAYVTWYSISVFIVPLTVLIVTYGAICRVIWRSAGGELGLRSPRLAPDSPPRCARSRRAPLISRAKINTVKQTVAVIAMYVACSTPFICAQLWATWDPEANESPFLNGAAFTILTLLSSLNSCVNPWIYLAFNRELPRLLLRHYAATSKNYRSAGTGNSASNSSGGMESTSLRPFSKWSLCSSSKSPMGVLAVGARHQASPATPAPLLRVHHGTAPSPFLGRNQNGAELSSMEHRVHHSRATLPSPRCPCTPPTLPSPAVGSSSPPLLEDSLVLEVSVEDDGDDLDKSKQNGNGVCCVVITTAV